jgi:hypothetical protein
LVSVGAVTSQQAREQEIRSIAADMVGCVHVLGQSMDAEHHDHVAGAGGWVSDP